MCFSMLQAERVREFVEHDFELIIRVNNNIFDVLRSDLSIIAGVLHLDEEWI